MKFKDLGITNRRFLPFLIAAFACFLMESPQAEVNVPLRIMPLGDSITAGYTDNPTWYAPFEFGYRSALHEMLTNGGVNFVFVGESAEPLNGLYGQPRSIGPYDLRSVQQDGHRGYGAYNAGMIRDKIEEWIQADKPDIILLHIGTVELQYRKEGILPFTTQSLSNLVQHIVNVAPETLLIVAQIIPLGEFDEDVAKYNAYVREELVPHFVANQNRVTTADHYTPFLDASGKIDKNLFANGWNHPNVVGYRKMAQAWFDEIVRPVLLSGPQLSSEQRFRMTFRGCPGQMYRVDRCTDPSQPWELKYRMLIGAADGTFAIDEPVGTEAGFQMFRMSPRQLSTVQQPPPSESQDL